MANLRRAGPGPHRENSPCWAGRLPILGGESWYKRPCAASQRHRGLSRGELLQIQAGVQPALGGELVIGAPALPAIPARARRSAPAGMPDRGEPNLLRHQISGNPSVGVLETHYEVRQL